MSWLFVHSQQAALSKLAAENSKLARSAANQQSAALKAVLTDQIQSSETELDTKARSLARLLADLAPTALLTFDTNALISLCKQATRDPDIERCVFFDPQGKKIAADKNPMRDVRASRAKKRPGFRRRAAEWTEGRSSRAGRVLRERKGTRDASSKQVTRAFRRR